jgi:hypothetical protein
MHSTTESLSPEYASLADLLLSLHDLIRIGQGDSTEADEIRDRMDDSWTKISDLERQRIDGMSADLYTLGAESPIQHADRNRYISVELSAKLAPLMFKREWDTVLDSLRQIPGEISWDLAAQYRAEAYAKLGVGAVAKRFLAEAWRLNPTLPDLQFVDAGIRGILI